MSFAATWMCLESIILSEVSQNEKTNIGYCLYAESLKNIANTFIYKTETSKKKLMVT